LEKDTGPDRVSYRIEDARDDLIALTQSLLRIPTINPPGDYYRDICELLATRLRKRQFTIEILRAHGARGDSDRYPRWNIVARHEGRHKGDCLHFNSHTDVVATGDGWTVNPFDGVVLGDRIYGRGACDMKGGLAASIIAVEAFIDTFPDYSGAIEISGTCDEESGGFGGVAWLAGEGRFSPQRVQHVIIPEPLNKDRICLGHRGVLWTEIETFGHIAHGSMPFQGDCAIRHMAAVLDAMEQQLFPSLAEKTTAMPVVPEGARQVPDRCRVVLDRRFLMEENIDDVRGEIKTLLDNVASNRARFRYEIRELFSVLPTMTDRNAPVVSAIADAMQEQLGQAPQYVVSPGT